MPYSLSLSAPLSPSPSPSPPALDGPSTLQPSYSGFHLAMAVLTPFCLMMVILAAFCMFYRLKRKRHHLGLGHRGVHGSMSDHTQFRHGSALGGDVSEKNGSYDPLHTQPIGDSTLNVSVVEDPSCVSFICIIITHSLAHSPHVNEFNQYLHLLPKV